MSQRKSDPQHDGIEKIPGIARLDRGAAPLLDADEASLLEKLQTFPDDRAAEVELLAEHRLRGKYRALGERTADDAVGQLLHDDRRKSPGPSRSRPIENELHVFAERVNDLHVKHHMF